MQLQNEPLSKIPLILHPSFFCGSLLFSTNWQAGSIVTLQFNEILTVTDGAGSATGAQADFVLAGGVNFLSAAGDTLSAVFDGTFWREVSRSVN